MENNKNEETHEIKKKINYLIGKKDEVSNKIRTNLVLYTIEKINESPFLYFLMLKNVNDILQLPNMPNNKVKSFMKETFKKSIYINKGCIYHKNENYKIYEMILNDDEFYPTYYNDIWWKVTPFEMIYSREVLYFTIDNKYIQFFIDNPNLLFLLDENQNKYEIPIIVYLGIGESELNKQLLLNNINYYKGIFSKGYYFKTFIQAYEDTMIDYQLPDSYILKLINYNYLTDYIYTENNESDEIIIRDNQFFFRDIFIGNVPSHCLNNKYKLESFDDDYIYLNSDKETNCTKTIYETRKENGIILRYVLMQNKNYIGSDIPKKYDSYSYNSIFMTKNQDSFNCLSYHIVEKDLFNTNEIKIN